MRRFFLVLSLAMTVSAVLANQPRKTYSWTDENGVRHYGDRIPAKYAEAHKRVLNEQGIVVDHVEGRKSEEQLAAERAQAERAAAAELRLRQDRALLATYLSVDEIVMHRDRRIELFQAQSRVAELYLHNLERQLEKFMSEAGRFQPYSSNPEAPLIDPDLVNDIEFTRQTIKRHENNILKFREDEKNIIERFDGDIRRFEQLKGLTTAKASG